MTAVCVSNMPCSIPSISCRVNSFRTAAGTTGSFLFCSQGLKRFVTFSTVTVTYPEAFQQIKACLYSHCALNRLIKSQTGSLHRRISINSASICKQSHIQIPVVFSFSELRSHLAAEHVHLQLAEGSGRYSPQVNARGEIQTSSHRPSADDSLDSPQLEVRRLQSHTNILLFL